MKGLQHEKTEEVTSMSSRGASDIQTSNRPHCQERDACGAKGAGHCRRCAFLHNLTKPEVQANRISALRQRCSEPEYRRTMSERMAAAEAVRMKDPAWAEMRRQHGKYGLANLRAKQTLESRERAALRTRAFHLSWCPQEYWEFNRKLKKKGFVLSERKRIIGEEVQRKDPAYQARRQIDAFNRQQRERQAREKAQAY